MAHKKAGGSSRNGRDSHSQRLGLKIFGGEQALAGNIIARQRGTKWHPGANVGLAKDHTLFALINGRVEFRTKAKGRVFVSVLPPTEAAAETTFSKHGVWILPTADWRVSTNSTAVERRADSS